MARPNVLEKLSAAQRNDLVIRKTKLLRGIYERQMADLRGRLLLADTETKRSRVTQIMKQVNADLTILNKQVKDWADEVAPLAYRRGQDVAVKAMTEQQILAGAFDFGAQIHKGAVNIVAEQMAIDLLGANDSIKRNAQRYLRATQQKIINDSLISKAVGENLVRGGTRRDLSDDIFKAMRERLIGGRLVEVNGKYYDAAKYAELVALTRTREATTHGILNSGLQYGMDLFQISGHSTSCDQCKPFQYKVYSASGTHPHFPKLDRMPPYHPRCQHVMYPVTETALREDGEYAFLAKKSQDANGISPEELRENLPQYVSNPSVKQSEELLKKHGVAKSVSLTNMTRKHAEAVSKELVDLSGEFKTALQVHFDEVFPVSGIDTSPLPSVRRKVRAAFARPASGTITFNTRLYAKRDALKGVYAQSVKDGYKVKLKKGVSAEQANAAHEFAHLLWSSEMHRFEAKESALQQIKSLFQTYQTDARRFRKWEKSDSAKRRRSAKQWTQDHFLGIHALKNVDEFVANAFVCARYGRKNSTYGEQVYAILKRERGL